MRLFSVAIASLSLLGAAAALPTDDGPLDCYGSCLINGTAPPACVDQCWNPFQKRNCFTQCLERGESWDTCADQCNN
ncbi:hypothetical protein AWENTII_002883 [Aspergillus wentii]|nr:hypothetical protein MW887_007563 [Aspergillus wentii]